VEQLSEKEQLEAIRGWWRDNGRYIISGILLGVALLVGWNYWQNRQEQAELEASALYESLMTQVGAVQVEAAAATAARLYENYSATVYAPQARLAMARLYMDVGRDQDAADELSALLADADDTELQRVGRLRLARILIYQDKAAEAIDLLQGFGDTAFAARYFEALGDAYAGLEQYDRAREAWSKALGENSQTPTVDRELIQMKLNDLPAAAAAGEEAGPAPDDRAAPGDSGPETGEPDEAAE
jgi:predicted negative regulator of RcsB-dependent stress response